ncbi:MAG: glycosyltransferase [Bdellovibrionales bacterium]|nr:glycosyltransferase [Bdellovibrionales bacterium]
MPNRKLNFVFIGLSLSSSWGNGHATTYRGLLRELSSLGHAVHFLECDQKWYRENRDLKEPEYCCLHIYSDLSELKNLYAELVENADIVVVGSYVVAGCAVGEWVQKIASGITAFYDIDTPVTLRLLEKDKCPYLSRELIEGYQYYFSFSFGPVLERIEAEYGARCVLPLLCSVDPEIYQPKSIEQKFELGYLGTYSRDRQGSLENFLIGAAKRLPGREFVVAGPQYPARNEWPDNVQYYDHICPMQHSEFYCSQRFTLNLTRSDMRALGYSPSVRIFEAAACGVPIISDVWPGLSELFRIDQEIFITSSVEQTVMILRETSEEARARVAANARKRVLESHTARTRACELERYAIEALRLREAA